MIRRPPRSTLSSSSAASDVYKRQLPNLGYYLKLEYVQNKVKHFFRFHDRDQSELVALPEFEAEEAKFVIVDRYRKKAQELNGSVIKMERELTEGAALGVRPLVLTTEQVEHARLKFEEYDKNGDGVDMRELRMLLKEVKLHITKKEMNSFRKSAFQQADRNSDGVLDFHEFLAAYSFFYVRKLDFDVFCDAEGGVGVDLNKDGEISIDEIMFSEVDAEARHEDLRDLRLSELGTNGSPETVVMRSKSRGSLALTLTLTLTLNPEP
eukprot:TRINITY_DN437_c0_g1_i18.p1 TRINITY_DN437_c0_g1~~TRINITY_DN437_c0_g1_i18.p1  ORF type:complete len:266 (+),score=96.16 TRINITY_DN437_c0_g1_i18:143-940(+)